MFLCNSTYLCILQKIGQILQIFRLTKVRLASLTLANSCRKISQNSSHLPWWMFLDSGLIWLRWKNEPSSKFELSVVLVWLSIEQSDRWLTAKSAFCLQPLAECFQRSVPADPAGLGWLARAKLYGAPICFAATSTQTLLASVNGLSRPGPARHALPPYFPPYDSVAPSAWEPS